MQQSPPHQSPARKPLTRTIDAIGDTGAAGDAVSLIIDAAGTSYDLAKGAVEAVVENLPDFPDLG